MLLTEQLVVPGLWPGPLLPAADRPLSLAPAAGPLAPPGQTVEALQQVPGTVRQVAAAGHRALLTSGAESEHGQDITLTVT